MANEVYGITPDLVLKEMGGIDRQSINDTSEPSNSDIEDIIDEGAGIMNGIIEGRNVSIDTDKGRAVMRSGIKAYAKSRIYEHFNRPQAQERAEQAFKEAKREARDMPEDIDGFEADGVFQTNVDTANPQRKQFAAKDRNNSKFGGFGGW